MASEPEKRLQAAGFEVPVAALCACECVRVRASACECVRVRASAWAQSLGPRCFDMLARPRRARQLPAASVPPAANYVPWVQTGNLVFISGQVPMKAGEITHKVMRMPV